MSPYLTVQYTPRCASCGGVLRRAPLVLFWLPDGHWDALCEDCSFALVVAAEQALDRTASP